MKCTRFVVLALLVGSACAGPVPGPDKQGQGLLSGAAVGAGTGAVIGFQTTAATGPGAAVGAGLGAAAGAVQGLVKDNLEDHMLEMAAATREEREVAVAQEILADHYRRRMELHPTRDIYPAEFFFCGDAVKVTPSAEPLIREIVRLNLTRYPWSRLRIATYVQARDPGSTFAQYLAERRARELGDHFVRAGIDPRRIETRAMIVDAPVLVDPSDSPDRYSQAVELIPADR